MKKNCTSCQSCGMPFEGPEDISKEHADLCIYCVDSSGNPKSYEEIIDGCASYFSDAQGMPKEAAMKFSREMLASLPKWKKHKE